MIIKKHWERHNITLQYYLISTIFICYVFRGVLVFFSVPFLPHILTVVLFLCCLFRKRKTFPLSLLSYIMAGIIASIISLVINQNIDLKNMVLAFCLAYVNFIVWCVCLNQNDNQENVKLMLRLEKLIVGMAVISGGIALYQTLVDVSVGGLANSGIYSSVEAMESGRYVRRATAFLGSAQNFGLFMGVSFSLILLSGSKKNIRWMLECLIILLGIFTSGSRSASSCVVIALAFFVIKYGKQQKISTRCVKIVFLCLIALVLGGGYFLSKINSDTLNRTITFSSIARRVEYVDALNGLDASDVVFGKGAGYKNYAFSKMVGDEVYYHIYGESYKSAESFLITNLAQGGIISLISIISIIILAMKKSRINDRQYVVICVFINMAFAPSMTGYPMSFIFWPFIIFEILMNKTVLVKNYQEILHENNKNW